MVRGFRPDGTLVMVPAEEAAAFEEQQRHLWSQGEASASPSTTLARSAHGFGMLSAQPSVQNLLNNVPATDVQGAAALPFDSKMGWFLHNVAQLKVCGGGFVASSYLQVKTMHHVANFLSSQLADSV